ncbi:hypothetical protein N8Y78_00145 [Ascidiaceihabitans sp.]|nr:hypothetical protein [Ascidiaceihabitans sp.]
MFSGRIIKTWGLSAALVVISTASYSQTVTGSPMESSCSMMDLTLSGPVDTVSLGESIVVKKDGNVISSYTGTWGGSFGDPTFEGLRITWDDPDFGLVGGSYEFSYTPGSSPLTVNSSPVAAFTYTTTCVGSSSSSSASTPATASASIIQSDIARSTRSSITASNSMMSSGIARLIEQQRSNGNVVSSNASALSLTPRLNMIGTGGLSGGGSLFGDTMTAGGVYRRITTGEFDIQKETGTGVTLSFNGRMAWERSLNEQTVLGYFIGVEGNDSNLTSTFAGDHKRLAGSVGIYALTELSEGVFAAGYSSFGIAQGDLDVTDGTDAVAGDYTYNTMALGGQLSGSIEQEVYELQPTLSVNYSKAFVGDISLTQTTAGTDSALSVAVGNTEFAELIASPRFLIPVALAEESTFTTVGVVAPRLLCEYSKSDGASVSNCGGGLELGLNGVSKNGMVNFNAGLRFDRINGADRQALSLQGTMEF